MAQMHAQQMCALRRTARIIHLPPSTVSSCPKFVSYVQVLPPSLHSLKPLFPRGTFTGDPPWGSPMVGESPMGDPSWWGDPPWGIPHGIPHGGIPPWGIPSWGVPHVGSLQGALPPKGVSHGGFPHGVRIPHGGSPMGRAPTQPLRNNYVTTT